MSNKIVSIFDSIAGVYDLGNSLMTGGLDRVWRKKLVRIISASSPCTVLDLGCGTGAVLRLLEPITFAVGADASLKMLGIAKRRKETVLLAAKAEQLPFPASSFEAITVAFGIRNMVPLDHTLKELARVITPGGLLGILEVATSDGKLFSAAKLAAKAIPHVVGALLGKRREYTYLVESMDSFPNPDKFKEIISGSGFRLEKHRRLGLGVASIFIARRI